MAETVTFKNILKKIKTKSLCNYMKFCEVFASGIKATY